MRVCSDCGLEIPEFSLFCPYCGKQFPAPEKGSCLYSCEIQTENGLKELSVMYGDITEMTFPIDLLGISAYSYSYAPAPRTLIRALEEKYGIQVSELARRPPFDLREKAGCWMSEELPEELPIRRIACTEMVSYSNRDTERSDPALLLPRIAAYFSLLDIASYMGVPIEVTVLPLFGMGRQKISSSLLTVPLVNETVAFLKRNRSVKKLIYMDLNLERITRFAMQLSNSLQLMQIQERQSRTNQAKEPFVFISYSSADLDKALLLDRLLEKHRIAHWYAKQGMQPGLYSTQIVKNIQRCTHFICLISHKAMTSYHVLNELNLAFDRLRDGVVMVPYFIEECELEPAFQYYLSTIEWAKGTPPPMEARMENFIQTMFGT